MGIHTHTYIFKLTSFQNMICDGASIHTVAFLVSSPRWINMQILQVLRAAKVPRDTQMVRETEVWLGALQLPSSLWGGQKVYHAWLKFSLNVFKFEFKIEFHCQLSTLNSPRK